MESCTSCLYSTTDGPLRHCRRNAPRPSNESTMAPAHGLDAWWPIVQDTDWCGEWTGAVAINPAAAPAAGPVEIEGEAHV